MEMNQKTIKYPYLPEGRSLLLVDMSNPFMIKAKEIARTSNDKQQPTGSVIVNEKGEIVSTASNKNPLTSEMLINLHKKYCIRHFFHIPSGDKYWLCPGCAGKESHAESRAVKQLIDFGDTTGIFDLYLWGHWWCCDTCWKNMLKIPIRNVYVLEDSEILFNLKNLGNILGKQFD
jgi:deoxycytidylate deaminase